MMRVEKALDKLGAEMILQVHDELVFEANEKEYYQVCHELKSIMEKPPIPEFNIPLIVDVEEGTSYGEMRLLK